MLNSKTTVYMYNGAKVEFPRKATRFHMLCALANNIRMPPKMFQYCTLFSGQNFCLPYSKKSYDTHLKGTCYLRFVMQLLHLKDLSKQHPEVFNYIYFQALHHFHASYSPSDHKDIACTNIALKLASLGITTITVATMEYLLSSLGYKNIAAENVLERVSSCLVECHKDSIQMKCKLIRQIQSLDAWSPCCYDYGTEKERFIVSISQSALHFTSPQKDIPLSQLDKVQFSFKHHIATLLVDNNKIELNLLSRSSIESFLTILDMAYKGISPGNMLLDHKLSDDLHVESLVYHDPEFTDNTACDTGGPIFNYSLVEGCCMVMRVPDKAEVEKILRFPGNEEKFLVTENFVIREHEKLFNQYYFFFLIGERFLVRTIVVVGGRFKIDQQQGYLSLFKLFAQIELMDKKGAVKKKREFVDYIKHEDIKHIAQHNHLYSTKGEPTLSPLNLYLSPVPTSSHYLYQVNSGSFHKRDMGCQKVSVTQFISHNQDFGSFILVPIIEHIKSLHTRGIQHENLVEYLGVYRLNHLPCLVEAEYGDLLSRHLHLNECSTPELYGFGKQIVTGLSYLHSNNIVHGFPALHNARICNGLLKLTFVGILPQLVKRRDVYNSLLIRDYLSHPAGRQGHPARWLHRSMIFSNAPWNIEIDR